MGPVDLVAPPIETRIGAVGAREEESIVPEGVPSSALQAYRLVRRVRRSERLAVLEHRGNGRPHVGTHPVPVTQRSHVAAATLGRHVRRRELDALPTQHPGSGGVQVPKDARGQQQGSQACQSEGKPPSTAWGRALHLP